MKKQRKIDEAIFDILGTMSEQLEIYGDTIKDSFFSREELASLTHTRHESTFFIKIINICLYRGYLETRAMSSSLRLFLTEKGVEFFNKEKERRQRGWAKQLSDFLKEYKALSVLIFSLVSIVVSTLLSTGLIYTKISDFVPNHTHPEHHTHINLSEHSQIKPLD